jgi:acyl carrier protein
MKKQEITDKILEIICNQFGIGKKEITLESTFYDFGVNSVDIKKVIFDIEKYYNVSIPDNIALNFNSITLVADYIISLEDYIDMVLNKTKKNMTKQEITDKILEILCTEFMIEKKKIAHKSTFHDFGIDSCDLTRVIIEIEKYFHIVIPDNMALRFNSINLILNYIDSIADNIDIIAKKEIINV